MKDHLFGENNKEQLSQIQADAKQLADSVADLVGGVVSGPKQRVEQLKEKAQEYGGEARDFVRAKGAKVDEYAHDRPWTSIAIAAVAGAVIGAVLSMGRRRWSD